MTEEMRFIFFFPLKAFIFQPWQKCSDTRVQQSANVAVWFLLFMNFSGVLGSDSQAILSVLFSLPCLEKTQHGSEKVRYLINPVCLYCSYLLYSSSSSSEIKKNIFVYLLSHRHMFSLLVLERSNVFLFVKNWMKN